MPNLASLSCVDIGQSSGRGISELWISGEPLIKENCNNFRTSDDTNMKLGPINKIKKRKETASKTLTMTSRQQLITSLSNLQLFVNLEEI